MKLCSNCRFVYYMVMNRSDAPCVDCVGHDKWQTAKPNNYDRVQAMNEEELARFISSLAGCPLNKLEECPKGSCTKNCKAYECWLAWLRKEYKNDTDKD